MDPLGLATIGQVEREAHQPQVMVKNRGQLVSQARGKIQQPQLLPQPPVALADLTRTRRRRGAISRARRPPLL
jgi:hypothetical protein